MSKFYEKLKNNFVIQVAFCVVSLLLIFVLYFIGVNWLSYNKAGITSVVDDRETTGDVISIVEENDNYIISGWILRQKSINEEIKVVLFSSDNPKGIVRTTKEKNNERISEFFSDSWDYGKIAYEAKIPKNKIKSDQSYEIVLALTYKDTEKERTYQSNFKISRWLYNGKIYCYDPINFVAPWFNDSTLNDVVVGGELCLYSKEQSLYIYKYENCFYWIAGKNFQFNKDGKTYISYQVGTSKPDLLPDYMTGYDFDNYDFFFENKECQLEDSMYRVAKADVPNAFPEKYFYTAIYDFDNREVIWNSFFYPTYNFE